jgi:hypothetical protein
MSFATQGGRLLKAYIAIRAFPVTSLFTACGRLPVCFKGLMATE